MLSLNDRDAVIRTALPSRARLIKLAASCMAAILIITEFIYICLEHQRCKRPHSAYLFL